MHPRRARFPFALVFLVLLTSPAALRAADWTMFRGPDRNGVAPDAKAPLEWAPDKNVKWSAKLPQAGNSSPVVIGDRVFVTCAEDRKGAKRSLYCFNRADGKQLWVKTVSYDKPDPTHGENPYCAATPATDGKVVVVWHGSAGVYCYNLDGKELWTRDLGTFRHIWGYAGSPVIDGDSVYLNCGPGERTFLVALDKQNGDVLWQTEEPGGAPDKSPATGDWLGSWSTPVVAKVDGQEQVLCFMTQVPGSGKDKAVGKVNAYDPKTGKVIWYCEGAGVLAYTDVLVSPDGGTAVAMAGYGGAAIGFKLGGGLAGNVTESNRLWRMTSKNPQRVGSGVIVGQHLFVPNEPNLACYELATGKPVWEQQFPGQRFWGSIVKVGDRLYVTSKQGKTFVFAADPAAFKLLATNDLGEPSNSTPAVSDGQIFLRTAGHLWCIEEK